MKPVVPAVPSSHPQRPSQYQGASKVVSDENDSDFLRKDLLTVEGDLLVQGASAAHRLGLGAALTVLKSDGTDPVWAHVDYSELTGTPPSGAALEPVTNGDLVTPELLFAGGDVIMVTA